MHTSGAACAIGESRLARLDHQLRHYQQPYHGHQSPQAPNHRRSALSPQRGDSTGQTLQ